MASFDRIESGFPGLDAALDSIRLGDNVVWQVTDVDEFCLFAEPFARQAVKDGRNVVYVRFAQHKPLLKNMEGIRLFEVNPDEGFESFTVKIHDEITRQGRDAFYVFDCLSELQSVWYTDLSMGNFFQVTCPYLFILDTVAYFPLIKGRHSFDAVARIRDTTQLLLDVCTSGTRIYMHPLKVWNRYSDRMFLPHSCGKDGSPLSPVENGVEMSRYYQTAQRHMKSNHDQQIDSYDRFFNMAKMAYESGMFTEEMEDLIIRSTMTKDAKLYKLVKQYFTPEDYFQLRSRMIGSGAIGGKACGMLLARKIAETEIPEYAEHNEPHDSFYIGSDVFYTYIVSNGGWNLRIAQRNGGGYFEKAPELQQHLLEGKFPDNIRAQFEKVLDYFGESPFIVRSSSFLEDGFGNAFAGKYESVFCVNQGTPEERMDAFEQAVRRVYASTMDYSALEYRRQRGLDKKDEQMAVLVQRVSGTFYKQYFMPCAAGVGYSHSAYKWYPEMDQGAGMLRIVMGLGTKAVDRTKEDYPRLSNLDKPAATIYNTVEKKHRFSQKYIDVLDCSNNTLAEKRLEELLDALPRWYRRIILEHDTEAEDRLRQAGRRREVYFVSCEGLLKNGSFTKLMQKILKTLEAVYENPVDIEYAINLDEHGDFVVNLLQCRPLYQGAAGKVVNIREEYPEKVLFDIRDSSMGSSGKQKIDVVVQIDPVGYYNYPYIKKPSVAAAIGKINRHYKDTGKALLLMTPGRIGTSSPELGVPVCFGNISNFNVICEVSEKRAGYMPELSYGSHMFQDMVEAEIRYGAIFLNERTLAFDPGILDALPDIFEKICPDFPELTRMVRVVEPENMYYWMDALSNRAICGISAVR